MKNKILLLTFLICPLVTLGQDVKYYALVYTTGENWDESIPPQNQPFFKEHSKHLADLRAHGILSLGARFGDKGLIILKAENEDEARKIVESDISVKNKTFKADLYPFSVFYPGNIQPKKNNIMTKSAIQNFQIPVVDFDRALAFYSQVMGYELQRLDYGDTKLGLFKFDGENGGIGGTIIKSEGLKPSKQGTMVYLNTGDDLKPYIERIEKAGGQVEKGKTSLGPEMGYFAIFIDSEGNQVGLYSEN